MYDLIFGASINFYLFVYKTYSIDQCQYLQIKNKVKNMKRLLY